jgi:hypothetical protein
MLDVWGAATGSRPRPLAGKRLTSPPARLKWPEKTLGRF